MANNSNSNTYRVTKRINDPMIALVFEVDQLGPAVIVAGIGNLLQMTLYGLIAAALWFWFSGWVKRNFPNGYLMHLAWWKGFIPYTNSVSMPDPLKREWFG